MKRLRTMVCLAPLAFVQCVGVGTGDDPDPHGPQVSVDPTGRTFGQVLNYVDVDFAEDVVVREGVAFVCAKGDGVAVIDARDLKRPARVATIAAEDAWNLALAGERLLVADRGAGLRVVDVAEAASPQLLDTWDPGWTVVDVAVAGGAAYAAGSDGGTLHVQALTVGADGRVAPGAAGSAPATIEGGVSAVAAAAGVVYVGRNDGAVHLFLDGGGAGLEAAGVLTPASEPGSAPWALGLAAAEERLYVAAWGAGLLVADVSKPASPAFVATFDEGNGASYDVHVAGARAFVAVDLGLAVLDVAGAGAPKWVGGRYLATTIELDDGPHGVAVEGGVAYVADNKEQKLVMVWVGEE